LGVELCLVHAASAKSMTAGTIQVFAYAYFEDVANYTPI
jgi:hypothetical protein